MLWRVQAIIIVVVVGSEFRLAPWPQFNGKSASKTIMTSGILHKTKLEGEIMEDLLLMDMDFDMMRMESRRKES